MTVRLRALPVADEANKKNCRTVKICRRSKPKTNFGKRWSRLRISGRGNAPKLCSSFHLNTNIIFGNQCGASRASHPTKLCVFVSYVQIKSIKPIKPSPSGEGVGEYLEPTDEGRYTGEGGCRMADG